MWRWEGKKKKKKGGKGVTKSPEGGEWKRVMFTWRTGSTLQALAQAIAFRFSHSHACEKENVSFAKDMARARTTYGGLRSGTERRAASTCCCQAQGQGREEEVENLHGGFFAIAFFWF